MSSSRGYHLILSLVLILFSSPSAFSKDAKSMAKNKNGVFVIGAGGGTFFVDNPKDSMDFDGSAMLTGGVEFRAIGPIHLSLGIDGIASTGKVKYDYTGPDAINYTGTDIGMVTTQSIGRAGVKFYLMSAGLLSLYAEGGAFLGGASFDYSIYGTPTAAQGAKYQTNQKNVWLAGTYGDAGIDIMGPKWGIRFAGRVYKGHSGIIHAISEERIKYIQALGYVAILVHP